MPPTPLISRERTSEARSLIAQARALLDHPEEEIVAIYLDHALEALQIVAEQRPTQTNPSSLASAMGPWRQ
ncbi:hypothetical protein [Sphingobium phenoxybenzoativorans]|uniref:hypothetical protein n=1 Tax=Sphingobium phenoxybenzoativorans TaxID=1592790 RepID=UPI001495C145|nr:hypothetical protein [Sphingobium phenoxybenzoativorans]